MRFLVKLRADTRRSHASPPADDELPKVMIAFNAAQAALEQQERTLESYRGRAGVIMSAAALSGAFLGAGFGTTHHPQGDWTWTAVIALAIAILLSVVALFPLWRWRFHISANDVLDTYVEVPRPWTVAEIYRELAIYGDKAWDSNQRLLLTIQWVVLGAGAALGIEIVSWVVSLK